ncbi:MAG TPA: hypothetical protein VNE16_03890 [Vicinamibacterales bacterium]|nr:hypothetical protein [Vicinamibacterales bacterium]
MPTLPPDALPAVPHLAWSVFNLAIPNLVAWLVVLVALVAGLSTRLPRVFEPGAPARRETR